MDSITHQLENCEKQYAHQQHAWPKQLNGVPLSRASSNSSSLGGSPARPPKSDRRRSSASPESVLQYTTSSPTVAASSSPSPNIKYGEVSSPPASRSPILSNLSLSASPPVLDCIRAGSTPVTPNIASFEDSPSTSSVSISRDPSTSSARMAPILQRNASTSTAEILASTLDSYHANLSRETSSASSSRYSSSVAPSQAVSSPPVASFTAGLDHQLSPSLGSLRIESTTGSKASVIKPDKKKKNKASSSNSKPAFAGGISSENIFGSTTDNNDDALSDVPSRASSRRSRALSISSRIEGNRAESQGISSDNVFGRPISPSSPRVPSLSNILSGLRGPTSRSNSQGSSRGGDNASRASSRASMSNASLSASASEHESVMSDKSKTSSSGKRRHRFSDVLKRKSDADRAEEEEHLRILSELRLKALALASEGDSNTRSSSSSSSANILERKNAELLVRDMEKQRLSRSGTVSSVYSNGSATKHNDDTITSPNIQNRISRSSSQSSFSDTQDDPTMPRGGLLYASDRPSADVPFDADGSDEESNARKSFAAIGRRATLMPTSSQSSLSDMEDVPTSSTFLHTRNYQDSVDDDEDTRRRERVISEDRRRSTLTPAHVQSSEDSRTSKSQKRRSRDHGAEGTEADIEDQEHPLTNSVLDRKCSTIKTNQIFEGSTEMRKSRSKASLKRPGSRDSNDQSGFPRTHRSPRTSAILIPAQTYPIRPRNESLSSSTSIRSINAESVQPPIRSSSRPDSPPSTGLPLDQRSVSMQSLSQRLHSREPSYTADMPTTYMMSSQHAREGASISRRTSEPPSPTSPNRCLSSGRHERLTSDIMIAMQSTEGAEPLIPRRGPPPVSRRSSAEQATRGVAPRPDLGYHRRSSSDMLTLMSQQRQQTPSGQHPRSSSTEVQNKALPSKPAALDKQTRRSASFAKSQQQQYDKIIALLTRNKPLPAALSVKEELRTCRNPGERAVLYAQKINDLAKAESGLVYWLSQTRPSAPEVQDAQWARRRGSAATVQSNTPLHTPHHLAREDNHSEAFPIRQNSQDVYKARDITQRTPSVAPSTMVPHNIPYPGVYEDSQTLRTSSAMSSHPPSSSSFRSQSHSFASAALNAAGLPKVGFFGGLGRKSSKRAASSRHKASDGASGLSISGPIRAPSPASYSSSGTRSVSLKPSGPRPSISASSSDRDLSTLQHFGTMPASSSLWSLASIPQGSVTNQASSQPTSRPTGSPLAFPAFTDNEDALTAMSDVVPQASKDVLARYLAACNGDQFAAISAYFDDERRNGQ